MDVGASVKKRCKYCKVVRRGKTLYVICKRDKRHKQKQG